MERERGVEDEEDEALLKSRFVRGDSFVLDEVQAAELLASLRQMLHAQGGAVDVRGLMRPLKVHWLIIQQRLSL